MLPGYLLNADLNIVAFLVLSRVGGVLTAFAAPDLRYRLHSLKASAYSRTPSACPLRAGRDMRAVDQEKDGHVARCFARVGLTVNHIRDWE